MNIPSSLNRRVRTWYGARLEPNEALRHPAEERRVRIPGLQLADVAAQLRETPGDRRRTALL